MRTADASNVAVEVSSVPIVDRDTGIPMGVFGLARPEDSAQARPPALTRVD